MASLEADAADASLLERALANNYELGRAIARLRPEGAIREEDGLLLIRSGPALPHFNFAAVTRIPTDLNSVLKRARQFYEPSRVHWALGASGEIAEAIAPAAAAAGLRPGIEPGMLLAPLAGEPNSVPGLTIQVVRDVETLRVYNDTMTAGFGGTPWATPEAVADAAPLRVRDMMHYLGLMDGVPVATSARLSSHRIAGVVNVSTIPAYRRRGIGEAMTWRAALDGREEGCAASYLQASELGLPVYRRMGYRAVTTHRIWHVPREW
ncbi:MAG TPA: GNAT family N-acetyltransferase [Steroidobacteraceae bacterium]|nr:GNAT family N-acetyltransferase [Steroidobacteraceae bacterium]